MWMLPVTASFDSIERRLLSRLRIHDRYGSIWIESTFANYHRVHSNCPWPRTAAKMKHLCHLDKTRSPVVSIMTLTDCFVASRGRNAAVLDGIFPHWRYQQLQHLSAALVRRSPLHRPLLSSTSTMITINHAAKPIPTTAGTDYHCHHPSYQASLRRQLHDHLATRSWGRFLA